MNLSRGQHIVILISSILFQNHEVTKLHDFAVTCEETMTTTHSISLVSCSLGKTLCSTTLHAWTKLIWLWFHQMIIIPKNFPNDKLWRIFFIDNTYYVCVFHCCSLYYYFDNPYKPFNIFFILRKIPSK